MKRQFLFLTALISIFSGIHPSAAVENNLNFSGALVSEPCDLDPNTSDITIDFKSVIEKYLYLNRRTNSIPFTINLINCDTSLGTQMKMTFKGTESDALPGLLAITGSATGIAVGMELEDGTPLPFNKPTSNFALSNNINSFRLQAYVEGEPDAIKNEAITPGTFSAIATFEITYE